MNLKVGDYCLCRISVGATLSAHINPPQIPISSPASSPPSQHFNIRLSKKPIKRLCLVSSISGNEMVLLFCTTFNGKPRPLQYQSLYLPIYPNSVSGELSVFTEPVWRVNNAWQYVGLPRVVIPSTIYEFDPPIRISKKSLSDVYSMSKRITFPPRDDQSQAKPETTLCTQAPSQIGLQSNILPIVKKYDKGVSDSELPLVFVPLVDIWVGEAIFSEELENEDDPIMGFHKEMNEIGALIDSEWDRLPCT